MTRLMKLVSCCREVHRIVYKRALLLAAVASVLIQLCTVSVWGLGRHPVDALAFGTPQANAVVRILNFNPANPQQGFAEQEPSSTSNRTRKDLAVGYACLRQTMW
jgi:hypothetical protein